MSKICQEPPSVSLCERGRVKVWHSWTQCDRMWQMHSLVSLFSCLHILSLQWLSAWGGGWKKVGVPNIRAKESSFGHRIKFRIYQYWQKRLSQKSSLILIEAPISKARYRIKDIVEGWWWRLTQLFSCRGLMNLSIDLKSARSNRSRLERGGYLLWALATCR